MSGDRELARRIVEEGLVESDLLEEASRPTAPDKYQLLRELGRGGAGTVYLARDRDLDRLCALKFLSNPRPGDVERFRREARFTARLRNPAIVQVYEMGTLDGRLFIAMQYVDGPSLHEAELELPELLRVAREVAVALHAAHREGIVHRDVKPQNVLLDSRGRAYLSDFGIARDLEGGPGTLSTEGQILGTPALMSPEQARGQVFAVDARTDVYAFGAMLYLELTGRYPFEGNNVVDLLHGVLHEEPPLPRSLRHDIPRALEELVVRCMRKAREDRYPSMAAVVEDLDRLTASDPAPQTSAVWFSRLVRTIVGGPPEPEPDDDLERDSWFTNGTEIVRELSAWDTDLYRVSRLTRTYERLDGLIGRLTRMLEARPDVAWARFYRGAARWRRGRWTEALEDMERAVDRVPDRGDAYFELGRLYLALYLRDQTRALRHLSPEGTRSHLDEARARLDQAVVAFQEAERFLRSDRGSQVAFVRAVQRFASGEYDAALALCDEILAEDPDAEQVWKFRGDVQRFRNEDPRESYERALAVRRSYLDAALALAESSLEAADLAAAEAAIARALEADPDCVDTRVLSARIGLARLARGSDPEALARVRSELDAAAALEPDDYGLQVTRAELELSLAREGKAPDGLERALASLGRARTLEGCQNRVQYLTVQVHLERARQALAAGRDASEPLSAAEAMVNGSPLPPTDTHWNRVREELGSLRAGSRPS